MQADEYLVEQQIRIDTDALTGVFSRMAYSDMLHHYETCAHLPEKLAAFTIDINGLKAVNDRLGHDAGDELICGAARCIEKVFDGEGRCFRTGGDEFVVISEQMTEADAEMALLLLNTESGNWHGKKAGQLSMASGCALLANHPGVTAEQLVREADMAMYDAKAEYYQKKGNERRGKARTRMKPGVTYM